MHWRYYFCTRAKIIITLYSHCTIFPSGKVVNSNRPLIRIMLLTMSKIILGAKKIITVSSDWFFHRERRRIQSAFDLKVNIVIYEVWLGREKEFLGDILRPFLILERPWFHKYFGRRRRNHPQEFPFDIGTEDISDIDIDTVISFEKFNAQRFFQHYIKGNRQRFPRSWQFSRFHNLDTWLD